MCCGEFECKRQEGKEGIDVSCYCKKRRNLLQRMWWVMTSLLKVEEVEAASQHTKIL
jgi:hypothetical protein